MLQHILICGLGSIGRRHLKHFRNLSVERIDAYRTGKATIPDEAESRPNNTYYSLEKALQQKPQAVIICNPTSMHADIALKCLEADCHLLIEKPLDSALEKANAVSKAQKASGLVVAIAHNFRYHPSLQILKEGLEDKRWGEALLVRSHFGAYLPDWHPWEDYKESYAAREDLGGGAILTHIHEVDFCQWLFGDALDYAGLPSTKHSIETNVDECTGLVMQHASGTLSSLTLSLSQKPATRSLHISFTDGNISLNLLTGILDWIDRNGISHSLFSNPEYDISETYRLQALDFVNAIEGKSNQLCTVSEAIKSLEIATSIRKN